MFKPKRVAVAVSLAFAMTAGAAHAVLERAGPPNNALSVGAYPAWYQDTTGLALEYCDPKNQAELDGGWCLILKGDVPSGTAPETFPTNFANEHFWFAADTGISTANGGKALLVFAVEAAFAADAVVPGDQIAFSRIRVKLTNVPMPGTYRFIHPYGVEEITCPEACRADGTLIFFTEDIGIACPPGQFDCALNSRLGPFLLPANTPGGPELPAVTGPVSGKLYIASPDRLGPVTGSPLPNFTDSTGASRNHNIFRVEGPAGSGLGIDPVTGARVDWIETTNFALMGRVFTGTLPGRVNVSRASYARDASGQKVDVFATASPTAQGRLPTQPRPASVMPQLTFYAAPCGGNVDPVTGDVRPPYRAPAGAPETQMFATGSDYWGQTQPAAMPLEVCIKDGSARDANGNVVPSFFPRVVTDEVTITQAVYDRSAGTLTVAARSSDATGQPDLTLAYGTFLGDLTNGQIVVPQLFAPPAKVRVLSSYLGAAEHLVSTGYGGGAPATTPVALNDSYTFLEDSGAQVFNVLANDSNAAGGTVNLTSAPRLGTATVGAGGAVTYTPDLNAYGTDAFTYTVTVGSQVSNTANVTLNITPVNDAPTAVNDSANTVANAPVSINVLANDTDPDGAADLVEAVNVTQPTPAGASVSVSGGTVTFNATAGGTYTFTYQAHDAAGAVSANSATVTVQVAAAETVTIAKNEYVRSKSQLKAQGSVSPAANQTVRVEFVDSAGTVVGTVGTYPTDGAGAWQVGTTVALPAGASALKVTTSNGTSGAAALVIKN